MKSILNASEAWIKSIADVMNNGVEVTSRGMETLEILNQTIEFDMNYPICHSIWRNLSYKFMAAEAYWITSGSPLVEDISPYNEHIKKYSDDGYIFNGAYGPAFINQFNFVVNTLRKSHSTRQAVMTIWHPNPVDTKDHKCTIALIFNIRDERIYTTVLMRSNDLILGRPYDMFNFTLMTIKVLCEFNKLSQKRFKLGTLTLHSASAHVYKDKFELAQKIANNPFDKSDTSYVPYDSTTKWQHVVDSLLACRDMKYKEGLWRIRP